MVRAPACKAGDPGLNPDPGENFSLKLTIKSLIMGNNAIITWKIYSISDHVNKVWQRPSEEEGGVAK